VDSDPQGKSNPRAAPPGDGMFGQGENLCPTANNARVGFSVPRQSGSSAGTFSPAQNYLRANPRPQRGL